MSKKLKIQFWIAEKALAMQILEQEGLPSCKEAGKVLIRNQPTLHEYDIILRGCWKWDNLRISHIEFSTNTERDEYLQKAVNAITDELFTDERELKVGEMCEVRDDEFERWRKRKLVAILSEQYKSRFIVEWEDCPTEYSSWNCARPIVKCIKPTIDEWGGRSNLHLGGEIV